MTTRVSRPPTRERIASSWPGRSSEYPKVSRATSSTRSRSESSSDSAVISTAFLPSTQPGRRRSCRAPRRMKRRACLSVRVQVRRSPGTRSVELPRGAMTLQIRTAELADVPALVSLYNDYVATTAITFDLEPVTLAARTEWFHHYAPTGRHRLLVADDGPTLLGYASTS